MIADATKPLAPLNPKDTADLGQPETFRYLRTGDRDISIFGWTIGKGQVNASGTSEMDMGRSTIVTVSLTTKGLLITNRMTLNGANCAESTGAVHGTPDAAYRWLLNDGNGRLGAASKAAWVQACRAFPPMAELEYEHV